MCCSGRSRSDCTGHGASHSAYGLWCFKKKTFNSWDRFIVPYPFSKGVFVAGEPIYVERSSDDGQMEEKRLELEASLIDLTVRADMFFD